MPDLDIGRSALALYDEQRDKMFVQAAGLEQQSRSPCHDLDLVYDVV